MWPGYRLLLYAAQLDPYSNAWYLEASTPPELYGRNFLRWALRSLVEVWCF